MSTREWWVELAAWLACLWLVCKIVDWATALLNASPAGYVSIWALLLIVVDAFLLIGLVGGAVWLAATAFPEEGKEV